MPNQTEAPKRIPAVSIETEQEAQTLKLTFANGQKLTLRAQSLTAEIQLIAMLHGLKQKLVDAAAISRNPDTGLSATVDEKMEAVVAVYQRLLDGEWNAQREGGGQASMLLQAMVEFTGKTPEEVKTWLEGKSDAQKKALALNPKIAAIINRIKADRAKIDEIDTDELLDELNAA